MDGPIMLTVITHETIGFDHVGLSSELMELGGFEPNTKLTLTIGNNNIKLTIVQKNITRRKNEIGLNPQTAQRTHLKHKHRYGLKILPGQIKLGPVVGIMADHYHNTKRPFGVQTLFIKELINSGTGLGEICFGFSPYAVNWNDLNITGYTHNGKSWVKGIFPLPDVLYPRAGFSPLLTNTRHRLAAQGVKILNPILNGKWQTYKILSQNPELKSYLPETKLLKNFSDVEQMTDKYHAVYLKPSAGSQGKHIIKVVKKAPGYEYQYELNHKLFKDRVYSLSNLKTSLKRVMGTRSYIIQKQIDLIRLEGSIVDVRILVQKDRTGEWQITGSACRIGKNGSITSNISSGGSGVKLLSVLKEHFPDRNHQEKIIGDIGFITLESVRCLERTIGDCGEMGVDIGIDCEGKCWFIEANMRPARHVFNLIEEKDIRTLSIERPMQYSQYLAEFVGGRGLV